VRAVIDTNVLVSGQFWHGAPHLLLGHVREGNITLILSPAMLAEFAAVIGRPKFQAILSRIGRPQEQILSELRQLAEVIDPQPLPMPICRDPDDDKVLALALAAQADIIISGDDDLLTLGTYQAIRILTSADALSIIAK
jgi:putative PIN family toxin of toxin-antitoxin system